jgi:FkbM family methyltransferase
MSFVRDRIRNNEFTNKIGRSLLRCAIALFPRLQWLTTLFRVYGTARMKLHGAALCLYSEADDNVVNALYYNRQYLGSDLTLIREITKTSKYFIDVGANTGVYSAFAAKLNPALTVLSLEPHPSNFKRLVKNISLNDLQNVRPHRLALGSATEDIEFSIPADDSLTTVSSAIAGFATKIYKIPFKTINVSQITLDEFLQGYALTSRDLIKIDVEYYEVDVLEGAIRTLEKARPMVFIEVLRYDQLVQEYPGMTERIDKNHADKIQQIFENASYAPWCLNKEKTFSRILDSDMASHQNVLFVPVGVRPDGF